MRANDIVPPLVAGVFVLKHLWKLASPQNHFFFITNDREASAAKIVFGCNDRCDQENLIAQIAGGVRALSVPVDSLVSNWAYMVTTCLAGLSRHGSRPGMTLIA